MSLLGYAFVPPKEPPHSKQGEVGRVDRRLRGARTACPTPLNRKFISISTLTSIRSCVAGEAKLCARVRHASLTLGLILGSCPAARFAFASNS